MRGVLVALTAAALCLGTASYAEHAPLNSPGGRPIDDSPRPYTLSGIVHLDYQGEYADFDLKLGNDEVQYKIKGNTTPDKGFVHTVTDISGVQIKKVGLDDGRTKVQSYPNTGTVHVYPRKRKMQDVVLAGFPVRGVFVKGFFQTRNLSGLEVGDERSQGKLRYNLFNGHYNSRFGLKFGDVPVGSTVPGRAAVYDYDNLPYGQNKTAVQMRFGDFILQGQINFTDTTRAVSDGDGNTTNYTVAKTGRYNVKVTKADGSQPVFSKPGEPETRDDVTARKLIAWLQLMQY